MRRDARDARQCAERDSALVVGLQRDGLVAPEVAVLDREHDLLIRERFAVPPEEFKGESLAEFREMPVVRGVRLVQAVERPRAACRKVALCAALAEHVHLAGQRHRELRETLGNADVVREHSARGELEILELASGRDPVERRRGHRELRLGEQRGVEVRFAEHQRHAHSQRRFAAGEELLALDVELHIQPVCLAVMLELRERRERAIRISQHELARPRLLRERHHDAAEFFVAHELAPVEPRHRVLHLLAALVQHREQIARRPRDLKHLPLPDTHERTAAASAADELYDPRAALSAQRGEFERLPRALVRPAVECMRLLAVRHEAVEVQVRIELTVLREEKIQRVHLVDFHDELRRVLHDEIDLHVVARLRAGRGLEELRIRRDELDVDAVLELLVRRRREQRSPLLGISLAAGDHRFCEHRLQPCVAHIFHPRREHRVHSRGSALREEVQEIFTHERLVVADGPVLDEPLAEVSVQVAHRLRVAQALDPFRIHIAERAGELEVIEEARPVIHALAAIVIEPQVKCARLQRIERRRQRLRVGIHSLQPRLAGHRVEFGIHIRRRREFAQFREDEPLVIR